MKFSLLACALILGVIGTLSAACAVRDGFVETEEIVAQEYEEERRAVGADLVRDVLEPPVVSTHAVDVDAFNRRLRAARRSGETWAQNVMQIALEYIGPLEGSVAALVKRNHPTESPTESTVTIIRDGLLDDSVRAIWDEIRFVRTAEGSWKLQSAERAYRCRRGAHQQHYGSELCP